MIARMRTGNSEHKVRSHCLKQQEAGGGSNPSHWAHPITHINLNHLRQFHMLELA